jgi:hypothetical protein
MADLALISAILGSIFFCDTPAVKIILQMLIYQLGLLLLVS